MKQSYQLLLLFALLLTSTLYANSNKANNPLIKLPEKKVFEVSATIFGGTSVCLNGTAPVITITGTGGTAPYTFTYKINNGDEITVQSTGNTATITAPTTTAGTFIYTLVSVTNGAAPAVNVNDSTTVNVVPNFTVTAGSDIIICKGAAINLTASLSSDAPSGVSYSWTGPNNYSSNSQNPTRNNSTAAMSGNYTVTTTIGSCERTDIMHVTVLEPVVSSANLQNYNNSEWLVKCTPPSATTGIIFLNNGIPSNLHSLVTGYTIDWGDSTPLFTSNNANWNNGGNINHTYNIGLYTLTISITTTLNCTITKDYTVFIGNQPASPQIQLPINAQGCVPFALTFPISGVSENTPGTTYIITFSDDPGNPIQFNQDNIPSSITHTFITSSCGSSFTNGTTIENNAFGVSMQAINPCGSASSSAGPIRTSSAPTAIINMPQSACVNQNFSISDQSINGSIVTANSCNTLTGQYWEVIPSTGWTLTNGYFGNDGGFPMDFEGWNNGTQNLDIQFNTPGSYIIKLYKKNGCIGTSTDTKTICIEPALTAASFTLNNTTGCNAVAAQATNTTVTTGMCNVTYNWTIAYSNSTSACGTSPGSSYNYFTNNTTATSANPSFNFPNPGTYTVTLTATNSCGSKTATQTVTVKAPPVVNVSNIPSVCGGASATITPTATVTNCGVNTLTYLWSFPGGTPSSSTSAIPGSISYNTSGNYTVTLEVTNECGTTTATRTFAVSPAVIANAGADHTLCATETVVLSGIGSGGTGSTYQYSWSPSTGLSNVNIANPTANPSVTTTYTLTVSNGGCTGTDQVTVFRNTLTPGTIATNQSLCTGGDPAIFTEIAAAIGAGTLTYQWESNTTSTSGTYIDIPGATAASYDPPVLTQNTWYRRKVTSTLNGIACTQTGNTLAITLNSVIPGTISGSQTICSGGNPVAFTSDSTASGTGTISYQWQSSIDGITFTNISTAATNATYDAPVLSQNMWYRRTTISTLNGVPCSDYSNVLTITLTAPPVISQEPTVTQTLCAGGTALPLTVTAGGSAAYTYQWYSNTTNSNTGGTIIASATQSTYTPLTNTVGTKYYYCIVSGAEAGCNDVSATAQVTIIAAPLINAHPQPQTLCDGQIPAALTVTYQNGTGAPSYQWYSNNSNSVTGGTAISGANTNTYQPSATVSTVYYYVVITFPSGGCSVLSSNIAAVTINALPVVATAQTTTICSGDTFTVSPADGGGNTVPSGTQYTWTVSANNSISGEANQNTPQNSISQALTNSTNTPVTLIYTVTPIANGCNGVPFTVTVTVNPKPSLINQTATTCTAELFSISPVDGSGNIVPAGTTYSWDIPVMSNAAMGGQTGTDAASIAGTLTNTTSTVQTATYTVTPKWTSVSETCTGNSFTVIVSVNPQPVITDSTETSCSGTAFSVTPVDGTNGSTVPTGTTYTWSAPAPQSGISGLSAGNNSSNISGTLVNTNNTPVTITYNVTPSTNGCPGAPFDIAMTVAPTPTVATVIGETLCNGSATQAVNFTGTVTGTVFNWTNNNPAIGLGANGTGNIPSFTATNTGTSALTGTITVTPEINGCNGSPQSFTITVNPAPSVSFSQSNQTICSGSATTTVMLSSATPGTTINWTATSPAGITGVATSGTTTIPVQTLVNNTNAPITVTYTATATTSGTTQCPGGTTSYTITVTPVPYANTTQQVSSCSGTPLNFIPTDGGTNSMPAGVTFTWSTPTGSGFTGGSAQNTPQTSLNQTLVNTTNAPVVATYTITPHFNGCDGVAFSTEVTVNPVATIPNATLALCSGTSFSFDPTTTATVLPAGTVYNWAAPTGTVNGGIAGSNQSLITGTLTNTTSSVQPVVYNIMPVSPLGNCNGTSFTLTVNVNPEFVATSTISNYNGFQISAAGANDAFINLTPAGGTGTYTYSWTGPNGFTASTQNITNIGPGTYTVTVSDGLCQSITQTFTITEPMPLVITEVIASHTNVDCFGQSTGIIEVAITQQSIAPYDYAILLQDGTVIENAIDLPGTSYVFDNLPAGTYNVRVTDANGTIKYINGIQVTQPATGLAITNSVVSNFNGFSISCNGAQNGSIDLTVNGGYPGYTYNWAGPNGFTATTEDLTSLSPGVYTVTILDTTNACPVTQNFTITEPQPVVFTGVTSAFNGYEISCFGGNNGSITIIPNGGTGAYTYAWTGPNGFTATTQNITGLGIGSYQLTMTDNNGCTAPVQSFTLTQPTALGITETHTDILCFGFATGAVDITVTGGVQNAGVNYTYAWTGPNGYTATTEDLVNVVAGAYNLTVTDTNGCTVALLVTLTQQPEIIITATTTPITCYGANNASISLNISGGNAPYMTQWSNLATGAFQDNLSAGNYVITVTDASNCIKQITVNIAEAPVFMVTPIVNQITCHGANNGSIALNLVGGIAPVSLQWSDGSSQGTTRNNLGPGTYTATITDGTPCQIVRTFTIVEPAAMGISATLTHALDCNDALSGGIDLTVGGGTPPYTYGWSNGATSEDLSSITSGTYSVTVIDSRGCSVSGTYNITRPAPITLNVSSDVVFNCDTHYVRQTNVAQASGGMPPFQYTWSSGNVSGAFGQNMNTNQNGTVIVTATDAAGCTATSTFEVETQQLGEANFTAGSYAFTTYEQYSISDPVQFDNLTTGDYIEVGWDFGDGASSQEINPSHTYLREGTYIVKLHVVYPYGCTDTYSMTIVVTKGYDVMVPNAFTPNADGHNDSFNAVHTGLKSIELNVFDTWGSLIYSEKGETIRGWNGYVKGNPSENGNFYYRINAETFYGQIIKFEGPFVLIR